MSWRRVTSRIDIMTLGVVCLGEMTLKYLTL